MVSPEQAGNIPTGEIPAHNKIRQILETVTAETAPAEIEKIVDRVQKTYQGFRIHEVVDIEPPWLPEHEKYYKKICGITLGDVAQDRFFPTTGLYGNRLRDPQIHEEAFSWVYRIRTGYLLAGRNLPLTTPVEEYLRDTLANTSDPRLQARALTLATMIKDPIAPEDSEFDRQIVKSLGVPGVSQKGKGVLCRFLKEVSYSLEEHSLNSSSAWNAYVRYSEALFFLLADPDYRLKVVTDLGKIVSQLESAGLDTFFPPQFAHCVEAAVLELRQQHPEMQLPELIKRLYAQGGTLSSSILDSVGRCSVTAETRAYMLPDEIHRLVNKTGCVISLFGGSPTLSCMIAKYLGVGKAVSVDRLSEAQLQPFPMGKQLCLGDEYEPLTNGLPKEPLKKPEGVLLEVIQAELPADCAAVSARLPQEQQRIFIDTKGSGLYLSTDQRVRYLTWLFDEMRPGDLYLLDTGIAKMTGIVLLRMRPKRNLELCRIGFPWAADYQNRYSYRTEGYADLAMLRRVGITVPPGEERTAMQILNSVQGFIFQEEGVIIPPISYLSGYLRFFAGITDLYLHCRFVVPEPYRRSSAEIIHEIVGYYTKEAGQLHTAGALLPTALVKADLPQEGWRYIQGIRELINKVNASYSDFGMEIYFWLDGSKSGDVQRRVQLMGQLAIIDEEALRLLKYAKYPFVGRTTFNQYPRAGSNSSLRPLRELVRKVETS